MPKIIIAHSLNFAFAHEQQVTMLQLQKEANEVMDSLWLKSTVLEIPYYRASTVESIEAIQHYGYKWWKNNKSDLSQTKMELIDILHFALSDKLRNIKTTTSLDVISDAMTHDTEFAKIQEIGRWANGFTFVDIDHISDAVIDLGTDLTTISDATLFEHISFNDLCEQLVYNSIGHGSTDMAMLFALFEKLGMTAEEVFNTYVGKNTLNKFRTANGQVNNDYCKIWDGREDNEYLSDFLERATARNHAASPGEIFAFLSEAYANASTFEKA